MFGEEIFIYPFVLCQVLHLTHVSECDSETCEEKNTCIKKHTHHTGSGIVYPIYHIYIYIQIFNNIFSPKYDWNSSLPIGSHRTPDTAPTFCRFRAGAPVVPRHKLPRYVVLSYDPPGRGHPTPGVRQWKVGWWAVRCYGSVTNRAYFHLRPFKWFNS